MGIFYKWVQLPVRRGQKKPHWILKNKETDQVVLEVRFSDDSEPRHDNWLRKKIEQAYGHYENKVYINMLRVYSEGR